MNAISASLRNQLALLFGSGHNQADASHTPKPHLRHLLADRFKLSDFDSASLGKLALAYQGEIDPLHQQTLTVIRQLHARFPLGIIPKGADASPPPKLMTLQQQEDATTLRFRDLLRSSMHQDDFQKLDAKIRITFGSSASTK